MNNRSYELQREKLLNAICVVPAISFVPAKCLSFHNITNKRASIERFEKFIRSTHPTVAHINYYGADTKKFFYQQKLIG